MVFKVTVEPSGRSFDIDDGESVLEAGIRQGIDLPYGCKDGACGSCKCELSSGEVAHDVYQDNAMSADEAASGMVLTCRARAKSDLVLVSKQVTGAGVFPVKKVPARVAQLERLSDDVMRLRLQLPASEALQFHAGQYVDLILKNGTRRSYSMAIAPHLVMAYGAPCIEVHIRHMEGGAFSGHVFSNMKEKEILRLEGPFGSFYLRESDKPMILLASGTGFAPIRAILEHMQEIGDNRLAYLYWGGRRERDLYMSDWILAQCEKMPNLKYIPVISDAPPEDAWAGRSGFVHMAVLEDFSDLSGFQVYACGAPIMVDSARADFAKAGLDSNEFFADAFTVVSYS